jgi:hypothetical protein
MLASAQSRTARQPPAHEILRSRLVNEFLTNFYRVVADFLTASSQYRCSFLRRGHRRLIARRISLKIGGSVFSRWRQGPDPLAGRMPCAPRFPPGVRESGHRVRITGQLIGAITAAHIWADHFDGVLDDIFDLQDTIASTVVGAIEPRLRLSEIGRAARKPIESLDAYDFYLRALGQFHKYTEEGVSSTIALLNRALAIDPSPAPAVATIGYCRYCKEGRAVGPIALTRRGVGSRVCWKFNPC